MKISKNASRQEIMAASRKFESAYAFAMNQDGENNE